MTPDALATIARILEKLARPHPCPDCGALTCASLCPACQEWQRATLEQEPIYVS
jgi:hypothetical protein